MRSTVIKISILFASFYFDPLSASNPDGYQTICSEIGFKKGTPDFGECVLELDRRATKPAIVPPKAVQKGDGTPDDKTCSAYGFQLGSEKYADCRLKLDMARKEYEKEVRAYQDRQREYERRVAALQAQQQREQQLDEEKYWACVAGTSARSLLEAMAKCKGQMSGAVYQPPTPPVSPVPSRVVIDGQTIRCREWGDAIRCTSD
jgi:hypothetical protein